MRWFVQELFICLKYRISSLSIMTSKAGIVIQSKKDVGEFENYLTKKTPLLVLYHAKWCPHCVDFVGPFHEPSRPWQQICDMIRKDFGTKVVCVEIEESNMTYLPENMNQIRGFPTLMLIHQGGMMEYQGGRDNLKQVKDFITTKTGISSGGAKKKVKKSEGSTTTTRKTSAKPAKKTTTRNTKS